MRGFSEDISPLIRKYIVTYCCRMTILYLIGSASETKYVSFILLIYLTICREVIRKYTGSTYDPERIIKFIYG